MSHFIKIEKKWIIIIKTNFNHIYTLYHIHIHYTTYIYKDKVYYYFASEGVVRKEQKKRLINILSSISLRYSTLTYIKTQNIHTYVYKMCYKCILNNICTILLFYTFLCFENICVSVKQIISTKVSFIPSKSDIKIGNWNNNKIKQYQKHTTKIN